MDKSLCTAAHVLDAFPRSSGTVVATQSKVVCSPDAWECSFPPRHLEHSYQHLVVHRLALAIRHPLENEFVSPFVVSLIL